MRGRPGLLRTILEAQETRGLTRSDDISRLLPSEVRAFLTIIFLTLLPTVVEAQETRGLTRSDDISRLLPPEVWAASALLLPTPWSDVTCLHLV